ncbi:MAG: hypothetical protein HZA94_00845 [Candidatus Vogelbacteria bacterium]|nr:hypothetical protein [Candidatus Vogelbacteria bacterium]
MTREEMEVRLARALARASSDEEAHSLMEEAICPDQYQGSVVAFGLCSPSCRIAKVMVSGIQGTVHVQVEVS